MNTRSIRVDREKTETRAAPIPHPRRCDRQHHRTWCRRRLVSSTACSPCVGSFHQECGGDRCRRNRSRSAPRHCRHRRFPRRGGSQGRSRWHRCRIRLVGTRRRDRPPPPLHFRQPQQCPQPRHSHRCRHPNRRYFQGHLGNERPARRRRYYWNGEWKGKKLGGGLDNAAQVHRPSPIPHRRRRWFRWERIEAPFRGWFSFPCSFQQVSMSVR
mmetsp:Transcript_3756/g.9582  ORF Transcript_3756/g.9582 Transcript_3756/m.9582 type:complete len:213 (-) Transcript_3756:48-686(-)